GRALGIVGGSPAILLIVLLFVGALWIGLLAAGLQVFPPSLAEALAFPPFSSYLTDLLLPTQIYGLTAAALLVALALTAVRALVWSVLTGVILERIEFRTISAVGVLQGVRAFPSVLVLMLVNVLAIVATNLILPVVLGPIVQLAIPIILLGGIYLFAFASAVAVRGPVRAAEAMRRSA